MRFVGPNCAGIISPGVGMMGIMPAHIYLQGRIGIVARSGTLSYEAAAQLKQHGLGVSTSVGIGGDPVNGSSFKDILELFQADPETDAVVLIGEVGGPQESGSGRLHQVDHDQAGRRLYRRPQRAQRPPHGPCRRDLGRRRNREGQGRRAEGGRRRDLADAVRHRQHHGEAAQGRGFTRPIRRPRPRKDADIRLGRAKPTRTSG